VSNSQYSLYNITAPSSYKCTFDHIFSALIDDRDVMIDVDNVLVKYAFVLRETVEMTSSSDFGECT